MKRIKFCSSLIEKLIILLPFFLSLLIFVCLKNFYPSIINLIKENNIENSDILSTLVDIGIFIISCIPLLFAFFKSFSKRIKSLLYRKIMRIYLSCHNKWLGLFCSKIINIFFRVKRLEIREQSTIVLELLNVMMCSESTQKLVFLTGNACSGKTTTILMFLEELILNRNYLSLYEKLEHNIYYYDFDSQFSFENFNNDYVLNKYDSSLLIIDNLHRESEEQFIQMLDLIMSAGNKAYGIFVVLRKPEEFLISQTKALNLFNSISDYCINVDCTGKAVSSINENLALTVYSDSVKFQSFLNSLGLMEINKDNDSIIYIHLYKIYKYYTKFYNGKVFDVFKILRGSITDIIMKDALLCIFLLCLHIGKFSKKDYYYIMKELKHGHLFSASALNTLLSINFIEKGWYEINSNQYLLHEELAKTYLYYILHKPENHDKVIHISKILYNKFKNTNILLAWYYSLLCRDIISYDKVMFDHVLNQANVKNMLSAMRYYWDYVNHNSYILCREYGVLNSIVGNEDTARKYLVTSFNLHPMAETLLELFEVKHKYYLQFKEIIHKACNYSNPYVYLGISYWDKHINMHLGRFDFYSYSSDANLIVENMQRIQKQEPYEGYHLLRRWYFDYFKIFFLSGILNYDKINQNDNTALYNIRHVLAHKSTEFNHYNQVYVLADYIQYVLLFKLRIEGIYPSKAELKFIGFKTDEEYYVTDKQLYRYALDLYDNAIKIMRKNGDHAFWHVINRKIDLLLQYDDCDFVKAESMLDCYLQHAYEIKCYEYVAYANMFLLKLKLIRRLILAHEDGKKYQIEKHIKDFRENYHKHNAFHDNMYAETRLRIYEALFMYQSKHLSPEEFKNTLVPIRESCIKQNYQRELILIGWLNKKEYSISPGELKFFYQSYPIIIQ